MTPFEEIALRQTLQYGGITVGLIAALLYAVFFCYREASTLKTLIKVIPLTAFATTAVAGFGAPLVISGLLLSLVGDAALSRKGDRAFLIGLCGFAAAHLAYIVHFLDLSGSVPPFATLPAILLLLLAGSTEVWLAPHTGALKWPVRIYVVLIVGMGLSALGLEARDPAIWGAFLFIASDLVLAIQLFRLPETSRWQVSASVFLWVAYVLGQLGILVGAAFARPLFHL